MKDTRTKTTTSPRKHKHFTDADRQMIEKLCRKGSPVSLIADLLGFHRSSVYRVLKRGRVTHLNSELVEFDTYSADRACDEARLRASYHGSFLKMADDFTLGNDFKNLSFTTDFPSMRPDRHLSGEVLMSGYRCGLFTTMCTAWASLFFLAILFTDLENTRKSRF